MDTSYLLGYLDGQGTRRSFRIDAPVASAPDMCGVDVVNGYFGHNESDAVLDRASKVNSLSLDGSNVPNGNPDEGHLVNVVATTLAGAEESGSDRRRLALERRSQLGRRRPWGFPGRPTKGRQPWSNAARSWAKPR